MKSQKKQSLSFVIPCYNESENISHIFKEISGSMANYGKSYSFEIVFVDDGSKDDTAEQIKSLIHKHPCISLIEFSRNFGKEAATSAGVHFATGDAIIMIDADGQHPVEAIPDFIKRWESGKKVVVGIRKANTDEGVIKKYGSIIFYRLFNQFSGAKLVPRSTDFRLIDKQVQQEFNKLTEINRITRGLIDWMGFDKDYIEFTANARIHGEASYTFKKLLKLAVNSFVSLSFTPLFIMAYLGFFMCLGALLTGTFLFTEVLILDDPLALNITGSGYLGILTIFLIGCVLVSQGLMSLYMSHIYQQSQGRPLYIVGKSHYGINPEK